MRAAALAIALTILIPAIAEASGARVPIACTSTVTRLEEVPGVGVRETEECASPTAWVDVAVGVDLIALQLTGKREVVSLGAVPSMGILIAWRPAWWTATPVLIGGELTLAMTVISPEILGGEMRHVEAWAVLHLNILGWLAVGIGGRFGIAVEEGSSDFARLVLTGGMRVPL